MRRSANDQHANRSHSSYPCWQAVAAVITRLQQEGTPNPVVVMVGDGATDLEAKPPSNVVIGFGGIVEREVVREKADWFVTDFSELTELIV